jgi:type IV secretion system protein VirB6
MDYQMMSGIADGLASGLDMLLHPLAQSWAEAGYFTLIYDFIHNEINDFRDNVLGRASALIGGIALIVMMCWVFFQGLRLVSGQSRDSMMVLVMNSLKATLIIAAATSMGVAGSEVNQVLTEDLQATITELVTGEDDTSPKEQIDKNLLYMHLAMTSIDAVQIVSNDQILNDKKQKALLLAGVGTAGPAMTGAAMLLLYEVAMAMFIGFGPIFILCLLFNATKSLFQRWLLYGIGTLFSMAVLSAMVAIATKVVVAVAGAFWATAAAGSLIGLDFSDGFAGIALQQGGIGILLTVLLISTPPMAASFFQGTLGGFSHYTAWQAGAGQRPGEAGYRGGSSPSSSAPSNYSGGDGQSVGWGGRPQSTPNQPNTAPSYANNPATNPNYGTTQVQADVVKTSNRPRQE